MDDEVDLNWVNLADTLKQQKHLFSWSACLAPFFLGFLTSFWDVFSDYEYAESWDKHIYNYTKLVEMELDPIRYQGFIYLFICLPVLMLVLTTAQRLGKVFISRICCSCCLEDWAGSLGNFFGLIVLLVAWFGAVILALAQPNVIKVMSYPCAATMLVIKLLPVIFQGPQMKILASRMSSMEAMFEATFQLVFVFFGVLQYNHEFDGPAIRSAVSSILTISKAGIENMLNYRTENNMTNASFSTKICLLIKFLPVFVSTTIFRITGLIAIEFIDQGSLMVGIAAVFLPLLAMTMSKLCCLEDLNMSELLRGSLGELGGITVWGRRGRERSRAIQLVFSLYYLLLYSPLLLYAIYFPSTDGLLANPEVFQILCIIALCVSVPSTMLYIWQIYYMDKFNILHKLRNLASIN